MSARDLAMDESFWVDRAQYDEAERVFYEKKYGRKQVSLTPLADEVAKARQRINEMKQNISDGTVANIESSNEVVVAQQKNYQNSGNMDDIIKSINDRLQGFQIMIDSLQEQVNKLKTQIPVATASPTVCQKVSEKKEENKNESKDDDDDGVDLFGSESEDDEAAAKIKEERLQAYNAKKSKKPALIAKSSIILDIKPWDDETNMEQMEAAVRKIECEGLLWGASKLVPLAYGIHKLQVNCIVEDEKVSIDWLQEQIESNEDYVQSVDIAAFNKI